MKILELFSGYGTASFALKRLGIPYELVGYSDIDKYANQCFKQNHCQGDIENKLRLGDATKINPYNLEDFDLLTGGFPCQSFSVAGKGLGELDTRGTLFREIIRIAEVKKPRWMLLENVKGLTNKNHQPTFQKILSELERIGYKVHWKILNTKDYGIPQNRERVFFVCFREQEDYDKFEFPKKEKLKIFLKDILEEEVDEKYYLSAKCLNKLSKTGFRGLKKSICSTITTENYKLGRGTNCIQVNNPKHSNNRVYSSEGLSPTLNTMQGGNRQPFVLNPYNGKNSETETGTLGTSCGTATGKTAQLLIKDFRIRKLTPKECFRLQGFLNDEVNLDGLSNTQQYKLAGNGQSVNVVAKIFEKMFCSSNITKTN